MTISKELLTVIGLKKKPNNEEYTKKFKFDSA
jgi:hypothetical protein